MATPFNDKSSTKTSTKTTEIPSTISQPSSGAITGELRSSKVRLTVYQGGALTPPGFLACRPVNSNVCIFHSGRRSSCGDQIVAMSYPVSQRNIKGLQSKFSELVYRVTQIVHFLPFQNLCDSKNSFPCELESCDIN
jgi:hypothetical protein